MTYSLNGLIALRAASGCPSITAVKPHFTLAPGGRGPAGTEGSRHRRQPFPAVERTCPEGV